MFLKIAQIKCFYAKLDKKPLKLELTIIIYDVTHHKKQGVFQKINVQTFSTAADYWLNVSSHQNGSMVSPARACKRSGTRPEFSQPYHGVLVRVQVLV